MDMTTRTDGDRVIREVLDAHGRCRDSLIPVLQAIQRRLGYVSEDAVRAVSGYLDTSENEIYGVATFYTQFRFTRPGDHNVKICRGTACHVRGCRLIINEASRRLGIEPGETTADGKFDLESVACFGSCALSPVVVVDGQVHGRMTPKKVARLLRRVR